MKKAKKTAGHIVNIFQGVLLAIIGWRSFTIKNDINFDSLIKIYTNSPIETHEKIYKSKAGTRKKLTFILSKDRKVFYTNASAKIDELKLFLDRNISKTLWIDPKIDTNGSHELWQAEFDNGFETILLISYEDRINNKIVFRKLSIAMGICGSIITICSVYEIILIRKK